MDLLLVISFLICCFFLLYEEEKKSRLRLKAKILSSYYDIAFIIHDNERSNLSIVYTIDENNKITGLYHIKKSYKKGSSSIKSKSFSKTQESFIISLVSKAYTIVFNRTEIIRNMQRGNTIYLINIDGYGKVDRAN
jgi:hypothetical protein